MLVSSVCLHFKRVSSWLFFLLFKFYVMLSSTMYNCKIIIITILFSELCVSIKYKPVFIIHGIITGNKSMINLSSRIKELHPGTVTYLTDRFSGWSSVLPMWHQVNEIGQDLMNFSAAHPGGINLIGYSQGGLIARGILEHFSNHNVDTFVSLSAPQAGQYGTEFLHLFFPNLIRETAYELFYSVVGQHTSVGNYWNDPHHSELYYNYSKFLPFVNNEIVSNETLQFKSGLTKLKKMILIGGPDDGVITPWQSSHFGYFNETEDVIEYKDRKDYIEDSFGLQTLDRKGRLKVISIDGVSHLQWHKNLTVIDKYIIPFLN